MTCARRGRCRDVAAAGGTALEKRVGHAFIKARIRKEDAVFGGEVSGHYYFRDFNYGDTGVVPALLIMEMLSKSGVAAVGSAATARGEPTSSRARSTRPSSDGTASWQQLAERYSPTA